MRKLVVSQFISLDGVIQAPGGAEEDTMVALLRVAGRTPTGTMTSVPSFLRRSARATRCCWAARRGKVMVLPLTRCRRAIHSATR